MTPTEPLHPILQLGYDAFNEGLAILIGFVIGFMLPAIFVALPAIFFLRQFLRWEIRQGFERLTLTQPDSTVKSFAADTTLFRQSLETSQEVIEKQRELEETIIHHGQTWVNLHEQQRQLLEEQQRYRKELAELLQPPPPPETDSLDKSQTTSTVDIERSSALSGRDQECVGEGISSKSQDTSVFQWWVKTKGSLGRGEDVMRVERSTPPEVADKFTEGFEDFNDPPLWGQDPKELEKEFGVTIKILDEQPDELSGSYAIRVSGSLAGVSAFSKAFYSHPPPGLSHVS